MTGDFFPLPPDSPSPAIFSPPARHFAARFFRSPLFSQSAEPPVAPLVEPLVEPLAANLRRFFSRKRTPFFSPFLFLFSFFPFSFPPVPFLCSFSSGVCGVSAARFALRLALGPPVLQRGFGGKFGHGAAWMFRRFAPCWRFLSRGKRRIAPRAFRFSEQSRFGIESGRRGRVCTVPDMKVILFSHPRAMMADCRQLPVPEKFGAVTFHSRIFFSGRIRLKIVRR